MCVLGLILFLCCMRFFVAWVFWLLLLSKNDKTQNILSMSFRWRLVLCFTPEMPLSSVDYLINVLQDLLYTGLDTIEVTKGLFLF